MRIFSKFNLENPRIRSWQRSDILTIIPSIRITCAPYKKIQGQGHSSMSYIGLAILPTDMPFYAMSIIFHIPEVMLFSKFYLGYPRSRSWVGSKFKALLFIDTRPFRSMSIRHPIPVIQLFQNLALKIKGQDHSSMPHIRPAILPTDFDFIPCQSSLTFLEYCFFSKFDLGYLSLGHGWGQSSKS